jgi:hypothetical protein
MTRTLTALAAASTIAIAAVAMPTSADARPRWRGPAFFGGLAAGAIIGGAIARSYYYPPAYYYAPGPTYYYAPVPGPVEYEVYPQDPVAPGGYPAQVAPGGYGCWAYRGGYRYYVC